MAVLEGCWNLDIYDANSNLLVGTIPLVTGVNLLEQYDYLAIGGTGSQLIVYTDQDAPKVPQFADLGVTGHVAFIPPGGTAADAVEIPFQPQPQILTTTLNGTAYILQTRWAELRLGPDPIPIPYPPPSPPPPPPPPPPPSFAPGAVSFGSGQGAWGFQPPADVPTFTVSTWLYVDGSQTRNPSTWPNGNIWVDDDTYLFNDPGTGEAELFIGTGGFTTWGANTGTPLNDLTNVTRSNPSIWTFENPHGLLADSYFDVGDFGYNNPGFGVFGGTGKILSVDSPTQITVDFDTTASSNPFVTPTGTNTPGQAGAAWKIFNALSFYASDSTGLKFVFFQWGQALPPGQFVNVIMAVETDQAAGSKQAKLYFGDTKIPLTSETDVSVAFNMFFSEANSGSYISNGSEAWNIFGTFNSGGSPNCFAGETWFAPGQFVDPDVSANRLKFHDSMGKPVSLGDDGSAVTGTPPLLYLSQPATPRASPVKWIDPEGLYSAPGVSAPYLELATLPMPNGITTTGLLTFSFWIDQFTKGDLLDLGNGGSFGNITLDYDASGNPLCTVLLADSLGAGNFTFSFPYDAGDGTNIRVAVDTNHPIGSKIALAYVGGSAASVTVITDNVNNMLVDWAGVSFIRFFWYLAGYIGDLWMAPGYFIDPGAYFYNAGAPGMFPPTTPAFYLHISGTDTADDFATNLGNGGAFNLTNGSTAGHFSLLSATEFLRNRSGLATLKIQGAETVGGGNLQLCPVSFP